MSLFKIAIVGDCYDEASDLAKRAFHPSGPAGKELDGMLADAGIARAECFITTVFNLRVPGGDVKALCAKKTAGSYIPGKPALVPAGYCRAEYAGQVDRVLRELTEVRPNITVLMGNTATWAVNNQTAVSKLRGAVTTSGLLPGFKILPTYHPTAIARQYDLRPVTVLDLMKAKAESEFLELRRPKREVWIDPTIEDIILFKERYIDGCADLAFDIETSNEQITCIGFAPSIDRCLVIPIWDIRKPNGSYWGTLDEELMVWKLIASILAGPEPKVGQNGLYDIQYLWMRYGVPVVNYAHDTMLLHHSLLPECPKGLDFLGSVYTNEVAWKQDRPRGKNTIKRED